MVSQHPVHQGRYIPINNFYRDLNGNPTGGTSTGIGFHIEWQNGVQEPNGAVIEQVIQCLIARLRFFNGEFPDASGHSSDKFRSRFNSLAITDLESAENWLVRRTLDRQARGVEGIYVP